MMDKVANSEEESVASSSCAAPEQEGRPAESGDVTDCWFDRPDGVIRVHRVPRRNLCVPSMTAEDVPSIPVAAVDVTRRTRTHLYHDDEAAIGHTSCGDDVGMRELSGVWGLARWCSTGFSCRRRLTRLFASARRGWNILLGRAMFGRIFSS